MIKTDSTTVKLLSKKQLSKKKIQLEAFYADLKSLVKKHKMKPLDLESINWDIIKADLEDWLDELDYILNREDV